MKRILMFATYTIANPQHGGQKRVRALYESYKDKGYMTRFIAVYFPPHYKEHWTHDIAIPTTHSEMMAQNPLTGDVITGRLVANDSNIRNSIRKQISEFNPDIIELEHPFLYIGLKSLLDEISYSGKIIYSSHNIEYSMKEEMLLGGHMPKNEIEEFVDEIKQAEVSLIQDADLIFAVSAEDAKSIQKLGASKEKIIVARNGINKEASTEEDMNYWKEFFLKRGIHKIALFVGSAHPPNWTGFQAMVGAKVGFLESDEAIVMAGSIGEYFSQHYKHDPIDEVIFWKRIISVGRLPESKLAALIKFADCMILPIIEGGGSNLKTAEALLSGHSIVGTTHAFRAFEKFSKHKLVSMTDDPSEFRRNIAEALRRERVKLNAKEIEELQEVTWRSCLSNAMKRTESL